MSVLLDNCATSVRETRADLNGRPMMISFGGYAVFHAQSDIFVWPKGRRAQAVRIPLELLRDFAEDQIKQELKSRGRD